MAPLSFQLPCHVGIIMDGNVRWANHHNLSHQEGHQRGMQVMCAIMREAYQIGLNYITFYCFSIENQARPPAEVDHIMNLGLNFIQEQTDFLFENQIRFRVVGERCGIPSHALQAIENLEAQTAHFNAMHLTCALNYGGRQEIIKAVTTILQQAPAHIGEAEVSRLLSCHIETAALPEADLIIRTSGEKRLSNFLLWQAAYSEFAFTDVYWPDFTRDLFRQMLFEYGRRERRFGRRFQQVMEAAVL